MKHRTSFSLLNVIRILILLVMLFTGLPIVGARSPESTSFVETQNPLSAAASVPGARFVHTSTAANTGGTITYIDHPLTNNNPNAIVLVTQNYDPGGVVGDSNGHPIGVNYSYIEDKWGIYNEDVANMPIGTSFNVLIPAPGSGAYVHTATSDNTSFTWTAIDHPYANNNPNAIVFVTQNRTPGGIPGAINAHPIGVWYNNSINKWAIFNEDTASMPTGVSYNVLIPPTGKEVFIHTATAANIIGQWSYIDHPLTDNNPNAILLVTQNWNPGGVGGIYNPYPIGVRFNTALRKWSVFNETWHDVPIGASFNVIVLTTNTAAFYHSATTDSIGGNTTSIDHPLTNNNPNAIMFVTQNFSPGGMGHIYNDHVIGVWYYNQAKKWTIFNQDLATMPEGAAFNVLIPSIDTSVFVHMARAANIDGFSTFIDHPLTNDNPNAIVFVTQNSNPSGVGGKYNNHAIGVRYDDVSKKWAIFNQDLTNMSEDAAFNMLVRATSSEVFVHTAKIDNTFSSWTVVDHPLTNGTTDAIVFATQNYNPGGVGGTYNDHPIGMAYNSTIGRWVIFNEDTASMPTSASFNVHVVNQNVLVVNQKVYLPIVLNGS